MSESRNNDSNRKKKISYKEIILPIAIGSVGLFTMSLIGYLLQEGQLPLLTISTFEIVNFTFTMQLYVLPLSFAGLIFLLTMIEMLSTASSGLG